MSRSTPPLVNGMPGPVTATIRSIDRRRVAWAEITGPAPAFTPEIGHTVETAIQAAHNEKIPLVMTISSTGADITGGAPALHAWGRVAYTLAQCSGIVPTIIIIDGPVVSGPALLLGLADLVIATESSFAFVNGPSMVREFTGVEITTDELGNPHALAHHAGVIIDIVPDRAAGADLAVDLLSYLPDHVDDEPPRHPPAPTSSHARPELHTLIPDASTGNYDVGDIIDLICDDDSVIELKARWADNVITALGRIDGRAVGVVANQPMILAGTLDIPASQKAARFVAFCDAFNLPILTLVDTPGFYPGKDLEWRGMIRHGAQLVHAYGRATVPRISVILRKSYGGAYIVMDSKTMGNDVCLAWPGAELAVMGAGQAAAILQRRASDEERAAFEADYAERLLNPYVAAERGYVDAVIDPADTRSEIIAALDMLENKREHLPSRRHTNEPL